MSSTSCHDHHSRERPMNRVTILLAPVAFLFAICLPVATAQQVQISSKPNPQVEKILSEISPANIEAIMRRLVGFGTRHTLSTQDDPKRGVGAAWRWKIGRASCRERV